MQAAQNGAARQPVGGRDILITYEVPGGRWYTELVDGEDRPETMVVGVSS